MSMSLVVELFRLRHASKNCREPFTFASPAQGMKLSLCCALLAAEVPNLRRDEGLLGARCVSSDIVGQGPRCKGVVAVIEMCCNVHLPMRWAAW